MPKANPSSGNKRRHFSTQQQFSMDQRIQNKLTNSILRKWRKQKSFIRFLDGDRAELSSGQPGVREPRRRDESHRSVARRLGYESLTRRSRSRFRRCLARGSSILDSKSFCNAHKCMTQPKISVHERTCKDFRQSNVAVARIARRAFSLQRRRRLFPRLKTHASRSSKLCTVSAVERAIRDRRCGTRRRYRVRVHIRRLRLRGLDDTRT